MSTGARPVVIPSLVGDWVKSLASTTTGSFAAVVPVATKPSTAANVRVFDRGSDGRGERRLNKIAVALYGTDADNETVAVKVVGWNQAASGLWVPTTKATVTGTMSSTLVGVAAHTVINTEFFCDGLALTTGGAATLIYGTSDIDIGTFEVDVSGYELVSLIHALGTGAAVNSLSRFL